MQTDGSNYFSVFNDFYGFTRTVIYMTNPINVANAFNYVFTEQTVMIKQISLKPNRLDNDC